MELLAEYPELTVHWIPCESHPRPDRYGPHSDLCARAMLFARDRGAFLPAFHEAMYAAAQTERRDIEDVKVVADLVAPFTDREAFLRGMEDGAYRDELARNNALAWEKYRFDAVPSIKAGDAFLRAIPEVGIPPQSLADFLRDMP